MDARGYHYGKFEYGHHHAYLLPTVFEALDDETKNGKPPRVFDLGCGNGTVAAALHQRGYEVVGIDPSSEGIAIANREFPNLKLRLGSAYDELASTYGQFPVVISLEVVEHVYSPRAFARTLYSLLDDGGLAVVSTPYHGYLKNLALALSGAMDNHFTALWDHGHIKFWSMKTLRTLLEEAGFESIEFRRVGRMPPLAKSMIALARK